MSALSISIQPIVGLCINSFVAMAHTCKASVYSLHCTGSHCVRMAPLQLGNNYVYFSNRWQCMAYYIAQAVALIYLIHRYRLQFIVVQKP